MEDFLHRNADALVIIENNRPSKSSIHSGYMPAFKIKDDYLTSGKIELIGCKELKFGEKSIAEVKFITPEAYPHCLYNGQKIQFQEGSTVHGSITIIEIKNPILKRL